MNPWEAGLLQFPAESPTGRLRLACKTCPHLVPCGGLKVAQRVDIGCAEICDACPGPPGCDAVCFRTDRLVTDAILGLGGYGPGNPRLRAPTGEIPPYIPTVYHRGALGPASSANVLAVPLWQCLERVPPTGAVRVRFSSGARLREHLNLDLSTRLVLVGVDRDWRIERYYSDRLILQLAQGLAKLNFEAAIPPNYSVWLNEPRVHHLYNRKRSLRVAEEWSKAGLPVAPYLVGVMDEDIDFWEAVYQANPDMHVAVKEFQTGLRHRPERAVAALDRIARLQDRLRRPLHLIALGGVARRDDIQARFARWTVIDATPFIKAVKRQVFTISHDKPGWQLVRDADQRKLFTMNVRARRARVLQDRFADATSAAALPLDDIIESPTADTSGPLLFGESARADED